MTNATPSAALAWLDSSTVPASGTLPLRPNTKPELQSSAVLQSGAISSKGFGSTAGGKGLPREKDCTSVVGASASSKGFSANISGKGIPNNKGFMPNGNGKGLAKQKDCGTVFGASAGRKGSRANKIGTRISVDAGGSPTGEENNESKNDVTYFFYNCKMNMDIVAVTHPEKSAGPTHALGRSTLPNGDIVFYDLIVLKSTFVHRRSPNGCTGDDLPHNNSLP